jgi:beta-phosphoglucomutase
MTDPVTHPVALIFDMDGVLIDNHSFHLAAWVEFCKRYGIQITAEEFHEKMFGGTNRNLMEKVFGRKMQEDELQRKAEEKEKIYRDLHRPSFKPIKGVKEFIAKARSIGYKTAIATAAPRVNLDFTLDLADMHHLFDIRLDDSMVTHGKPDPEIYIKAAGLLEVRPDQCIVFEDSLTGIKSAQSAGMRVIGVSTSLTANELGHTWKVIPDFSEITIDDLEQ